MLHKHALKKFMLVSLVAFGLGGCTTGRLSNPFDRNPSPQPIEGVPAGPVEITDLPPLDPDDYDGSGSSNTRTTGPRIERPVITQPAWRSMVGPWRAQEASGSCKVNLSSTSTLDFYKASTSGCTNKELAKVSSWEYRDGEVYLYQSGGTVAARLKGGAGQLEGVLQSSGANLSLSK